ncbi:MAG: PEGA domain-containing protein [Candidatus Omnitrophica bacterium]|nr:PEGA domain-containing protein [Candidatus Omnitrophota bacterium]
MSAEQRIRAVLFYVSVFIFVAGLPLILSFALGYKFNTKTLKFTKTGLIVIKTQPSGASIYFDNRLLNEKTPATIQELLPGNYNVRLSLEKYYDWFGEINVDAGKVSRLEKIIFFPLRSNIKQLNKDSISSFWLDKEKEKIYYSSDTDNLIYISDLDGGHFTEIGILPDTVKNPKKWKISPDREKVLCFDYRQVAVSLLAVRNKDYYTDPEIIIENENQRIIDLFWHSDSYHFILVTDKNIEVLEAKAAAAPVTLITLNKRNVSSFYDERNDVLYFIDSQKAEDDRLYDNVYKLDLNPKSSPFINLIKPKEK